MGKVIVISGIGDTRNNGCWAMAESAMDLFEENDKDVRFIFLKNKGSVDEKRFSRGNIEYVTTPWTLVQIKKLRYVFAYLSSMLLFINFLFYRIFGFNLIFNKFSDALINADACIDLSGDSISIDYDDYSVFYQMLPAFYRYLINKPFFFVAQSIGPLKNSILYSFVKFVLKRSSLITAREKITFELLKNHGIENTELTADLAFLLKKSPDERAQQIFRVEGLDVDNKYVGISVSNIFSNYSGNKVGARDSYVKLMARLCDHINSVHGYNVIFVPHVTIPWNDDREISNMVISKMANPNCALVLSHEYNASELKSVIGKCAAFVASRMHAGIGAISANVPTLMLSYNHKTIGIFDGMLALGKYIVNYRNQSRDAFEQETMIKLNDLLLSLPSVKLQLEHSIPAIRKLAKSNLHLINEYLYGR